MLCCINFPLHVVSVTMCHHFYLSTCGALNIIHYGLFCSSEGLIDLLKSRRGQDGAYIGCMKSGEVVSEE